MLPAWEVGPNLCNCQNGSLRKISLILTNHISNELLLTFKMLSPKILKFERRLSSGFISEFEFVLNLTSFGSLQNLKIYYIYKYYNYFIPGFTLFDLSKFVESSLNNLPNIVIVEVYADFLSIQITTVSLKY